MVKIKSAIKKYVELKIQSKEINKKIAEAYDNFSVACNISGAGNYGPAIIYQSKRLEYRYNFDILALEQELADAKHYYEAYHKPVAITKTWCVKFNGAK